MREAETRAAPVLARIEASLDRLRPGFAAQGHQVELVEFDDETGALYLRYRGECERCAGDKLLLNLAIERALRETAPEVQAIIPVV